MKSHINDSVSYILNNEKTEHRFSGDEDPDGFSKKQLGRECKYIENDVKTVDGAYVSSINLSSTDIKKAVDEMMEVKRFYGKIDGRLLLHGIISLPEEESDINNAPKLLAMCNDVMRELFPEHQVIMAVHTNTKHLHVHFIVNSVGLNGKKIHQPEGFQDKVVHPCVNKYAAKYGFLENDVWKEQKKLKKSDFIALKIRLREAIDNAIENADGFNEFIKLLEADGFTINIGKYLSVKDSDMGKPLRTHQLGLSYTKEAIIERIRTKKLAFEDIDIVSALAVDRSDLSEDTFIHMGSVLGKFDDMSKDERKRVISLLKQGVNPWKQHREAGWQLKRIADDLNMTVRFKEYIKYYSDDGTVQSALDNILSFKKQIAAEKKETKRIYRQYKPLVDMYKEMKQIEKNAYLYEHKGVSEYRLDYERYRELTRRMKKNYNRTVDEVAAFVDRYEDRILYANAQLEELSTEYRDILQYNSVHKVEKIDDDSILSLIGFEENMELSRHRVFDSDVKYLVSSDNPDVFIRIMSSPYINEKGRMALNYSASLVSISGEVIEECESRDGIYDFKKFIGKLENEYGLTHCKSFSDSFYARSFASAVLSKNVDSIDNNSNPIVKSRNSYSFTQAINILSAKNANGTFVIENAFNPDYMAIITTMSDGIKIKVLDRQGVEQISSDIPAFKDRNNDGFSAIWKIKKDYGFSDEIYAFDSVDEAQEYIENETSKNENERIKSNEQIKL